MNIASAVSTVTALAGRVVSSIPGVNTVHSWTRNAAINSKLAREALRMVVYSSVACMIFAVGMTFKIILLGKLDASAGIAIGGIFTLLGTVLAVTVPAFAAALNATDVPPGQPPTPPANTAP